MPRRAPEPRDLGNALTTSDEANDGGEDTQAASCPPASKVGTATISSPLIEGDEQQFEGNVYILPSNPPKIRLLVAASADGVNLKLSGTASLCESAGEVIDGKTCSTPGQVIASFNETPPLPFSEFTLKFQGGSKPRSSHHPDAELSQRAPTSRPGPPRSVAISAHQQCSE